jgi:hypothetical protein
MRSAHSAFLSARKPPMLTRPSFFALIVHPSPSANISRAMSRTECLS